MKTLTTFALLSVLAFGSSANAAELGQDMVYYGAGRTMCGTCCPTTCCEPTCRPACEDCSYSTCCPTYHQKCVDDPCNPCAKKTICCRDVKGIFDGCFGRWFW